MGMGSYAASQLVKGRYDEGRVKETCVALRESLSGKPQFGVVFATPDYTQHGSDFLELIRLYGHVPTLIGCTGIGLVGPGEEMEGGSGFSLMLVSIPNARVHAWNFSEADVTSGKDPDYWHQFIDHDTSQVKAWLIFAEPSSLHVERWIKQWNRAFPGIPTFGGLATSHSDSSETALFHDGQVISGGIVMALEGDISVRAVVSQGCKPIGEPLTVTQAQRNILLTLGSRPAYEVLSDVYQGLTDGERELARGHLFAGLAINEYLDEYKRGDFLVRSIIGADPKSGAVAISAEARVGQTVQYQLRDPEVAAEELRRLVTRAAKEGKEPYLGILCTCIGRGRNLFRQPNHDVSIIQQAFPRMPISGVFTSSEIGPVGNLSFTHGYTASLALIAPS